MPSRADVSTASRTASMPGAVPFDARQVPLRRPAPVAVHDDGDVRGQPVEVDLARQRLFRGARRNPRQDLFERHTSPAGRQTLILQAGIGRGRTLAPTQDAPGPVSAPRPRRSMAGHEEQPGAGAVGPARRGRGLQHLRHPRRPPPAQADLDQRPDGVRTMCRRKPSPVVSKHDEARRPAPAGPRTPGRTPRPSTRPGPARRVTVLVVVFAALPAPWNAAKSWSPSSSARRRRPSRRRRAAAARARRSGARTGWRHRRCRIRYR